MEDPNWWVTFDYKLTLVVVVVSALLFVIGGIWRLSNKYSHIIHELGNKVSHRELSVCKDEIVRSIGESGRICRQEIDADRVENRTDHKSIILSLAEMNRLFVGHIDKK